MKNSKLIFISFTVKDVSKYLSYEDSGMLRPDRLCARQFGVPWIHVQFQSYSHFKNFRPSLNLVLKNSVPVLFSLKKNSDPVLLSFKKIQSLSYSHLKKNSDPVLFSFKKKLRPCLILI